MSDHNLTNEVDPLKSFDTYENRQTKGLELKGVKRFKYLGNNQIMIQDLPGGIEYNVEYLSIKRVLEVLPFQERGIKLSFEKLVCYHDIIFNFDTHKIYIQEDPPSP